MPANLPPQYYEAERRYREAQSYEEKISLLQEMLAIMPKHKGTDKLQADLRAKISKLKKAGEKKAGPRRRTHSYRIPREGVAQVILIGAPNTGKSSILAALTNATPQIAPYPFTTYELSVGMILWENIKIQLVDTPPIATGFKVPWLGDILKMADLLLATLDLGEEEILEQMDSVMAKLEELKIKSEGDKDEELEDRGVTYKKIAILANKEDLAGGEEKLAILKELYGEKFPIISTSTRIPEKMEKLKEEIYRTLGLIRVYTKVPGQSPDLEDPIVLKRGSLVIDAARSIHKDFARNLKYARMWGVNKFKGQKVEKEHPLEEGDILEFHI
jgi:hypothetical protein